MTEQYVTKAEAWDALHTVPPAAQKELDDLRQFREMTLRAMASLHAQPTPERVVKTITVGADEWNALLKFAGFDVVPAPDVVQAAPWCTGRRHPEKGHVFGHVRNKAEDICSYCLVPKSKIHPEPIPKGINWSREDLTFFHPSTGKLVSTDFHNLWQHRRFEFPIATRQTKGN